MVGSQRLVIPSSDDLGAALRDHILRLQQQGRFVVLVTFNQTAAVLGTSFAKAGVDLDRIHIVDTVTAPQDPVPTHIKTTCIGSPTLVELVAMRTQRIAAAQPDAHVVLCCVNALMVYNGRDDAERFLRVLADRTTQHGVGLDLLMREDPEQPDLAIMASSVLAKA